jgi:dienelactone hydrolase
VVFAGAALLVSTKGMRMAASAGRARIVADHPAGLMDAEISIELQGFPSRQPVTIAATQVYPSGSRWRASATFITDDTGSADLGHQAPVSGTYDGASAMGLIWSAERVPAGAMSFPDGWIMQPWFVHLEASAPDGTQAELILERTAAGPGVTRQPIRTDGLVGTLFLPPGGGPHPGVLVLGGGGGGIDEFRGAMLASHGYAALNLGYFAMPGLPRGLVNIPLEYFEQAIIWMRAQPWLRDRFLAVWGESRGGELALLLGSHFSEINAVAAWVPSGVVFWALGLAEPGDARPRAAWTFRGKPLPYLQENNSGVGAAPVAQPGRPIAYAPIYLSHLQDKQAVERATIPVENIKGPVQLVSGIDDQQWPSSALADIAVRRLEAHRHPYPFEHLKYEGAGHRILLPLRTADGACRRSPGPGFRGWTVRPRRHATIGRRGGRGRMAPTSRFPSQGRPSTWIDWSPQLGAEDRSDKTSAFSRSGRIRTESGRGRVPVKPPKPAWRRPRLSFSALARATHACAYCRVAMPSLRVAAR